MGEQRIHPYCFFSGVRFGEIALSALCEADLAPAVVVSYPPSLSDRSGYADFSNVTSHYGLKWCAIEDVNVSFITTVCEDTIDLGIVCGWSQLFGDHVLARFPLGVFGLHPTALPQGRGRAPIPWTLINDLRLSAVSLFRLDTRADAGPLVAQVPFTITDGDDAHSLYERIATIQANLLVRYVPELLAGTASMRPQIGAPTYWPKRQDDDGKVDWQWSGRQLFNWIRGLTHPYPGAWTVACGRRLRIWRAELIPRGTCDAAPGTVLGNAGALGTPQVVVCSGTEDLVAVCRAQFDGADTLEGNALVQHPVFAEGTILGA